jgi:glycerol 2-dehydrogenase (NADP+)
MEEVYRSGKVKAIGVSNWSIPYLEDLKKKWTIVPAVNQVELHAWNPQHKLKAWCDEHGILLEAYCPLGSTGKPLLPRVITVERPDVVGAPLLEDPDLAELAKKNDTTVATLLISYQVNRGCVVLPKSVTKQRIIDNHRVIPLSAEDVQAIGAMAANGKQKRVNTPKWGWDLGFADWYGPVQA